MRRNRPVGQALLDLTSEAVAGKVAIARKSAVAAGRDPDTLRFHTSIQSLHITDIPGAKRVVSSLAADVTDPAILADSPSVLHGPVASCVEKLQQRRGEFGLDYFHMGCDPLAAAPVVARLS
jgi:hypothetical protein